MPKGTLDVPFMKRGSGGRCWPLLVCAVQSCTVPSMDVNSIYNVTTESLVPAVRSSINELARTFLGIACFFGSMECHYTRNFIPSSPLRIQSSSKRLDPFLK